MAIVNLILDCWEPAQQEEPNYLHGYESNGVIGKFHVGARENIILGMQDIF